MNGRYLFLIALMTAAPLAANPRTYIPSTDFDGSPSGARFIGMGEVGTTVAGGPESPIWNPAALHDLNSATFSADFDVARQSSLADSLLTGNDPLRGRQLTYLGFAAKDGAFFYRPLTGFNKHVITDPAKPDFNYTEENLSINQFGFGASSEGEKGTTLGVNVTYLAAHRSYAVLSDTMAPSVTFADGNGFTVDAGLRKKWDNGTLGASFFNIPGILYWNRYKPDQLPTTLRAGISFNPVSIVSLMAEYEKRFYRGNVPKPDFLHFGTEVTVAQWLVVRGGMFGDSLSDREKVSYTAGFSVLSQKGYQIDFAVRMFRYDLAPVKNYFLSIVLPLPDGGSGGSKTSSSPSSNINNFQSPGGKP